MHLADAQKVLNKPGKISEILALGCKCKTVNRVEEIKEQLEAVLPEAQVMEMRLQAIARQDQRSLVEQHYAQTLGDYKANRAKIAEQETNRRQEVIDRERAHRAEVLAMLSSVNTVVVPLVVFVSALWVGLLAFSNVRERRYEIGLLRALGKNSRSIAALFLGKAALLGLAGGLAGCLLGYALARWLALGVLNATAVHFAPSTLITLCTIAGTPLVAAIASYLPTLAAVGQDPAVVLVDN
jgi:ABC-type antimicrobial peptide transport system permease subunit